MQVVSCNYGVAKKLALRFTMKTIKLAAIFPLLPFSRVAVALLPKSSFINMKVSAT